MRAPRRVVAGAWSDAVNRQIVQLFGLFALLFAVLVVFTTRWTVLEAESLADNPDNRRPLIEEQRVPRGLILASDGTVLARSRGEGRGQNRIYSRTYPTGPAFGHPVGFSYIRNGRRGLELSRNDDLTGDEDEFESILAGLESRDREGNDVVTNLDVAGTQAAVAGLAGRKGAVVAIEPRTGKVRVMVSIPEYDPNLIPSQIGTFNRDRENQPLLNRTTQELYPPGSTFKVVTATAGLDTGTVQPETVIDGSSPREISGVPLENSGGQDFGPISFTDALTNSVNTVFAQVGERVGRERLVEYMKRFGFYEDPQLDYPDSQMIASGILNGDGDYVDDGFDVGRVAIGQGGLEGEIRSGPLQMAQVAAAVGNGGRLMKPRLTDRIVQKDGRVKERIEPDLQAVVMKPETAEQLAGMMSRVVEEGTGTAGALAGIRVAGKTGTAEVGANREFTQPWFIAFAPVEDPRMAIAVTVERTTGQGGTVAAPIAKSVLEALIGGAAG
jgi:penicillin-binding protein A